MKKFNIDVDIILKAIKSTNEGISISDAQQPDYPLIYVNEGFENMTGYRLEEIAGKNCRFLQRNDTDQPYIETIREALRNSTNCKVLLKNYKKDGTLFWNELNLSPIKNDQDIVTHYVGIQADVTAQEECRKKIEFLSFHDELTGLLNRRGLYTESYNFYAWADRSNQQVVVIMIDLNNFKSINDTQGHQEGDIVLVSYAEAFRKNLRKNDLLARVGGDEFVILIAMDKKISSSEINHKIDKIFKHIETDTQYYNSISVSYGLACAHEKPANDLDAVIYKADTRMYAMKKSGVKTSKNG